MSIRPVHRVIKAKPALEGAGVHSRRAFGFGDTSEFDPFLLLDDFRNDVPADYLAGFPWHPHRGIETITYVLAGTVEHGDSMGTAGRSGGRHPVDDRRSAAYSTRRCPRENSRSDARVPAVGQPAGGAEDDGAALSGGQSRGDSGHYRRRWHRGANRLRKLLGEAGAGHRDRHRSDVRRYQVPPGKSKPLPVETSSHAFAYVFAGSGKFCNASGPLAVPTEGVEWLDTEPPAEADNRSLILFDRGDEVVVQAGEDGIRFLLVSGRPLREPVAWYGPIVMNTQAQLKAAFEELHEGTFIKKK